MDSSSSERQEQLATIKPWSAISIKKCPKCSSPFIDQFCDSCGFKQTVQNITDLAVEDFYHIKDQYMDTRSPLVLLLPLLEKIYPKRINIYLLKVKRRVKNLIEIMIRAEFQEGSTSFKSLHQLELYDALNEITFYQNNLNSIKSYPEKVYQELRTKNVAVDSQGYAALRELISTYVPRSYNPFLINFQILKKSYWREMKLLFICTGSLFILVFIAFQGFKTFS